MALVVAFTVHSVSNAPHRTQVAHRGEMISASVDCVEVELVSDGAHGSFTARFVGADAILARETFKPGTVHTWTV